MMTVRSLELVKGLGGECMAKKYNVYAIVRNAIRKLWLQSPQRREAVERACVREHKLKKDGTPAKRASIVGYRCESCGGVFDKIQVHHINEIGKNPFEMKFDDYIKAMWCPADKLKVLCKGCHKSEHKKGK